MTFLLSSSASASADGLPPDPACPNWSWVDAWADGLRGCAGRRLRLVDAPEDTLAELVDPEALDRRRHHHARDARPRLAEVQRLHRVTDERDSSSRQLSDPLLARDGRRDPRRNRARNSGSASRRSIMRVWASARPRLQSPEREDARAAAAPPSRARARSSATHSAISRTTRPAPARAPSAADWYRRDMTTAKPAATTRPPERRASRSALKTCDSDDAPAPAEPPPQLRERAAPQRRLAQYVDEDVVPVALEHRVQVEEARRRRRRTRAGRRRRARSRPAAPGRQSENSARRARSPRPARPRSPRSGGGAARTSVSDVSTYAYGKIITIFSPALRTAASERGHREAVRGLVHGDHGEAPEHEHDPAEADLARDDERRSVARRDEDRRRRPRPRSPAAAIATSAGSVKSSRPPRAVQALERSPAPGQTPLARCRQPLQKPVCAARRRWTPGRRPRPAARGRRARRAGARAAQARPRPKLLGSAHQLGQASCARRSARAAARRRPTAARTARRARSLQHPAAGALGRLEPFQRVA